MVESGTKSEKVAAVKEPEYSSETIDRKEFSPKTKQLFVIVRVIAIVMLICLILSEILRPDTSKFIEIPLFIIVVFLAFVRSITAFYNAQLSQLGLVTEITFIVGIVIVLIAVHWSAIGFLSVVGFHLSFGLAPLLGIINRAIQLKRKEAKSVGCTVGEMIILSISVVIVTWVLVRFAVW
ncbi:MAG: hypothetical protein ACYS9C_13930 [Planctomycetota bacterium]|jgi:hypothetical protein